MSDKGKEILSQEKRMAKAKDVRIVFTTPEYFNVVDEFGSLKYVGRIRAPKPHVEDSCTCKDFENRNSEEYVAEHGFALQCKHLIAARSVRFRDIIPEGFDCYENDVFVKRIADAEQVQVWLLTNPGKRRFERV